jgi:fructokinase
LRAEIRFETTTPRETIQKAIEFLSDHHEQTPLTAVGIASFGPLDLHRDSPTFGHVTTTPKPGWSGTDLVGRFRQALALPVAFDTDVNAAALAEHLWGAARGLENFVYLTVGTGIGGGALVNGALLHGLTHPEMGHIRIPHDLELDPFPGACPFHGDCLEGLASGRALEVRLGARPEALSPGHPVWELESDYLALGLVNYIATLSPERVVMGGGVMNQRQLFILLRRKVREVLNDYIQAPEIVEETDRFIVPAALGDRAGVLGAIALARREVEVSSSPPSPND